MGISMSFETCCCNKNRILPKSYIYFLRQLKGTLILLLEYKNRICVTKIFRWNKKDYATLLKNQCGKFRVTFNNTVSSTTCFYYYYYYISNQFVILHRLCHCSNL